MPRKLYQHPVNRFDVSKREYVLQLKAPLMIETAPESMDVTPKGNGIFNIHYRKCNYIYDGEKLIFDNQTTTVPASLGAIYYGYSYLYEIAQILRKPSNLEREID